MSCRTDKVICKHRDASKTYYVSLDEILPIGVTIVSASSSTEDASLTISVTDIVTEDTTVNNGQCGDLTLKADRAVLLGLSGGASSDSEVIVTVQWTQSDGDSDAVDCRLLVE